MPRKPRIEIPGFYHLVNRGVEQRTVFEEPQDYKKFEALVCEAAKTHGVTLHNYCLMSNHYHLLVEIEKSVLSKFMRQINAGYAIYFNKKYHRSGHLWQGRFRSWYVTDEAYLYALILYIEQNPLRAGLVERPERYPYATARYFTGEEKLPECLKEAWLITNFEKNEKALREMLSVRVSKETLSELEKASSLVEASIQKEEPPSELLEKVKIAQKREERNAKIVQAYEAGHSQHAIAKAVGISQPAVYGILRRMREK
ncbi:transposase [Hydrogenimonas cancrithermarum]|uniref:Transposase IS200-like domain-containing protein n=1 Tax=Hydrogenimonas cancrithermarum TaxID=2993563 RepID=A0ABN6WWN2_9BACT|nr:transposase [Hydrogenimonas cancrithermarum]BDY13318.1 hypothetical protein HCR_16300 [Hydrogenimonas cancrithermarum]